MHAYLKGRLYSCLKVDFTMRHIKKYRHTVTEYIFNDLESSRCSKIALLQTYWYQDIVWQMLNESVQQKVAVSRNTARKLAWAWNPKGREQENFWKWVVIIVLNSWDSDGRRATQVPPQTLQAFPVTPLGSVRWTNTCPVQNQPPVWWSQNTAVT